MPRLLIVSPHVCFDRNERIVLQWIYQLRARLRESEYSVHMLGTTSATNDPTASRFNSDLVNLIPFLRAFARSLCGGEREIADDLAQEALAKAWKARSSFTPGTNLKAWLFTILRNEFYSDRRRGWRQQPWDEDIAEQIPDYGKDQIREAELSDTIRAMRCLSDEHREALVLVAAGGHSYDEAALICGCKVGTVKSRVSRARQRLLAILDGRSLQELPDRNNCSSAPADLAGEYNRLLSAYLAGSAAETPRPHP